jgi:protein TonB
MRENEILNANLLDIIFENRNKNYGAYALRKFYPRRLTKSLSISLGLVLILFLLTLSAKREDGRSYFRVGGNVVDISEIEPPKPKEPDRPKPVAPTKIATIPFTDKIIIADKTTLVTQTDINNNLIGTKLIVSSTTGSLPPQEIQPAETNTPFQTNEQPLGVTKDAEYPGGKEKFTEFLKIKLTTPEDLEAGQKIKVFVRFKVDVDGNISQIEVIESGGIKFDNEVMRVLKKMPKWSPAMQNGIKVSSYFIQVVTFIGEEQ